MTDNARPQPPSALAISRRWPASALLLPAVLTLVALPYLQMHDDVLLFFDDPDYSVEPLRQGFSWQSLRWAFGFHACNWHPLTWLSHMLDWQIAPLHTGFFKFHNLALHLGSAAVFYTFLRRAAFEPAWAGLAAFVFAAHPLRVSSVAWVAERKDCLCVLLCLGTMLAYQAYAAKPSLGRYAAVTIAFVLALLAKPLAVTLPAGLLLLDIWPLRRLELDVRNLRATAQRAGPLVAEKLPWLCLSAAAAWLTLAAQTKAITAGTLWAFRLVHGVTAYGTYLWQTLVPGPAVILHPVPDRFPAAEFAASAIAVLAITVACFATCLRRPWLLVGWLWFLGTLLPMSGIVTIGAHAHADRYTYLPHVMLMAAVVFELRDRGWLVSPRRFVRTGSRLALAVWCGLLPVVTFRELRFWNDSEALFAHTLDVTGPNPVMERHLGGYYDMLDRHEEALAAFAAAYLHSPDDPDCAGLLIRSLQASGQSERAEKLFRSIARHDPSSATLIAEMNWTMRPPNAASWTEPTYMWQHLAESWLQRGEPAEAVRVFERIVTADPADDEARARLQSIREGVDRDSFQAAPSDLPATDIPSR